MPPTVETLPIVIPTAPRLREALERAFAEPALGPRRHVHAIVVMHDGQIIAEQYAAGFTSDTPLLAYSVSKSVVNALVGVLVKQGRLDVHARAPVAAWNDLADPRHALTLDSLMRMTSGLALAEADSGFDPVSIMLFQKPDMAGYAAQARLMNEPGKTWEYTSGNTLIVSGVLRDVIGGGAAGMIRFAHRELFDPIGMHHVLMEFDGAQTLVGSTRCMRRRGTGRVLASFTWMMAWRTGSGCFRSDGLPIRASQRSMHLRCRLLDQYPCAWGHGTTDRGPPRGCLLRLRHEWPACRDCAVASAGHCAVWFDRRSAAVRHAGADPASR